MLNYYRSIFYSILNLLHHSYFNFFTKTLTYTQQSFTKHEVYIKERYVLDYAAVKVLGQKKLQVTEADEVIRMVELDLARIYSCGCEWGEI